MKNDGTRIIIGDFFETAAVQVMCDAKKEGMTQENGYVWFLPAWYRLVSKKMIGAWSYKYSRYPAKQLVCTKILHLWMLAVWQTSQSYNLILHRDWSLAQKPSLGS